MPENTTPGAVGRFQDNSSLTLDKITTRGGLQMGGAGAASNKIVSTKANTDITLAPNGTGKVAVSSALDVTGAVTLKGQGAKNTVAKTVSFTASSATIASGAMVQPANTTITGLSVTISTATAQTNGTLGVKVGNQAAGAQIVGADADSLHATATDGAIGSNAQLAPVGTSAGAGVLEPVSAVIKFTGSARNVHFTVTASAGAFTAGAITFIMEYENIVAQA